MPVDPHLQGFLDLVEAAPYPPMHEADPAAGREGFRAMTALATGPDGPAQVASVEDTTIVGDIPVRIYRPEEAGPVPTLVFLHGGGFVIGDLTTHDNECRRLCRDLGSVVVSVDYRLAPEHPFPVPVEDAVAATRWVVEHRAELGGSDRVGICGDSAGGNLSAVVTQNVPGLCAQLLIYPAVDPLGDYPSRTENAEGYFLDKPTMEWFFDHYAGGEDGGWARDVRLAPLLGSLDGLPPAVVVTAEFDPLRDEGEAYAAALAAAGVAVDPVRYDGLIHGFFNMGAFSPAAEAAIEDLVGRFRPLLHG